MRRELLAFTGLLLAGCFDTTAEEEQAPPPVPEEEQEQDQSPPPPVEQEQEQEQSPPPPPPPAEEEQEEDGGNQAPPPSGERAEKLSQSEAYRFLVQATFGGSEDDIEEVINLGLEGWLLDQFQKPSLDIVARLRSEAETDGNTFGQDHINVFWERALHGEDQLRQRVAYALSQIVVVSLEDTEVRNRGLPFAVYADALEDGALGNYCDMVREVSLLPAMGIYLTHLGNGKADGPIAPDENYARELLQLFTIGLEELAMDGTPLGRESYNAEDVSGLARVFTGFTWAGVGGNFRWGGPDDTSSVLPMEGYPEHHEPGSKTFLGRTVDLGAGSPEATVDAALDIILGHPNVPPFISKQLIQRLVTSNPRPAYVRRVAEAFDRGRYTLPSGEVVGSGRRCDMRATIAAILLDEEARNVEAAQNPQFGKLRAPVLRIAHLLRAFRQDRTVRTGGELADMGGLRFAAGADNLGQNAYSSPSVFNYFRPGFSPVGSEAARNGMLAPEFQILTAGGETAYVNYAALMILTSARQTAGIEDRTDAGADFTALLERTEDLAGLIDHLDLILTGGRLSDEAKAEIREIAEMQGLPEQSDPYGRQSRIRLRIVLQLIVTSPEFIVQR